MFGALVTGRLPDTAAQQVDVNKFMFPIVDPESANHVTVFMLGTMPFEPGYAGGVYLCWPGPEPAWYLLGFISNDKPSATFRIAKTKPIDAVAAPNPFGGMMHPDAMMAAAAAAAAAGPPIAQIGVSIEPIAELTQHTPLPAAKAATASDFATFTQKTVESLFQFLTSFAVPREQALRSGDPNWVPLGALQRWHENYLHKLHLDPNFWKK
eukprot:m.491255 g.491255  ORF g.491255 m.491255 type:complete len:210 (+) comp29560_c0_seq1:348-977(+)